MISDMLDPKQHLIESFRKWYRGRDPLLVSCAPGRVNLVGEHTDYNDGLALPMTLDRAVYVAVNDSLTGLHELRSLNYQESISCKPGAWPEVSHAHWATYVAGMIQELPPPRPVAMMIYGDIPPGAGLSSSAALEMAAGLALEKLRNTPIDPLQMARIGQTVEHKYARVKCGIMDQIVSRVGRAGHALFLDCQKLEWKHVPIRKQDAQFMVIDSRVKRQLAHSKYNERRAECHRALQFIRAAGPQINSLRQVQLPQIRSLKESVLRQRIQHVFDENERVRQACSAITDSDWNSLGMILSTSHESLRTDYEVSCEELDFLVTQAESCPGVFGARMMGGGFGGCSMNLVRTENAHLIAEAVSTAYEEKYRHKARIYVLDKGMEAHVEWL